LLGAFKAKGGRQDIFKLIIGNEIFHEIRNENGVRVVNFATSKNLTMLPHRNIHKRTCPSPHAKTHNQFDHILTDRRRYSIVLDVRSFMAADCETDHYLEVAMIRERLAVNKQGSHTFHTERFNQRAKKSIVLRTQIGLQR
jgi:hypothetical protein